MTPGPMWPSVDLWVLRTADVSGAALLDACAALLGKEEHERRSRFVFEKHRHEYLATRVLCRVVLGGYLGLPAGGLRFRANEHGRPELDPPGDLSFNLTNCLALVACVVCRGAIVGVDAEPLERADTILDVAESVFTDRERSALASVALVERRVRAVRLWTAKEAYMKARGLGMSLPPRSFEVDVTEMRTVLRAVEAEHDDGRAWDFDTREIDGHVITTCVEQRGAAAAITVSVERLDLGRLDTSARGVVRHGA
jgi:4'-phosphopantetheinyl transferase